MKITKDWLRQHQNTVNALLDILHSQDVPPQDGETILLYLAGMSAGLRQANTLDGDWLAPISVGYKLAAEHGDEV